MGFADELEWETLGVLPSCGFLALGDKDVVETSPLPDDLPTVLDRDGDGAAYALAECDGLPIELGLAAGEAVAVRAEFTDDVEDLAADGEGRWSVIGSVRIGDAGALACDWKYVDNAEFRCEVPLPPGTYNVEAFETDGDFLGVRLVRD